MSGTRAARQLDPRKPTELLHRGSRQVCAISSCEQLRQGARRDALLFSLDHLVGASQQGGRDSDPNLDQLCHGLRLKPSP